LSDLSELGGPRLAVGLKRSYGDTCLFADGRLLDMSGLDRFIAFDRQTGLLKAEAGLSLDALLRVSVPLGWFVPVTPGTRRVTLGGAVANDVHGKNHHRAGSFGRHVKAFTLLRSDRGLVEVTPETEPVLFAATIGGLGLTGVILDVTLQLVPIASSDLINENLPLGRLDDYFALDAESSEAFEHTVAWIDCTRTGRRVGLGVYSRANWAPDGPLEAHSPRTRAVPAFAPAAPFNALTVSAYNRWRRVRQLWDGSPRRLHYSPAFHPLDAVEGWNRLYGRSGFYQHQCVVPRDAAPDALREMLDAVARSGQGTPVVVLKSFGDLASPGWMSFPRPGHTLALDFKNRGRPTLQLLDRLDAIVREAEGTLYPAKDGRMPREMLDRGYPRFPDLLALRDPACGSDFLARMEGRNWANGS
jgi:FAD/FMN-containing dehydrogenase